MRLWRPVFATLLLAAPRWLAAEQAAAAESWLSEDGMFQVSYTSTLNPIEINTIHSWVLHLEAAGGGAVEGAVIQVTGGMPDHDHGLPTSPQVTQALGNGDYLVEGLRFHMNGAWEIEFTISAGEDSDTVTIPLDL